MAGEQGDWQKSLQAGWERRLKKTEELGEWASGLGAKAAARTERFWATLAWSPSHVTLKTQGSEGDRIVAVQGRRQRGDPYVLSTKYMPGMESAR